MAEKTEIKKAVEIKTASDMVALVKRIDKGDPAPADVQALSKEFDKYPALYRSSGNLQNQVFSGILADAAAQSAYVKECAKRYIEEMKTELGYYSSTFVEKMLIDEIVMRWLRLTMMDSDHKNATSKSHTLEQGMYVDKRLHLAQKRYLQAIDTLAKVRKMIAQTQAKGAEMFINLTAKD